MADLAAEPALARTGYTTVFRSPYLKRTLFVGIFWTAQVIPLFALHSFAPDLLAGMGITGNTAEVFLAVLFVIGGIPGLWLVERSGRRALLLGSFGIIAVALGIPGLVPGLPTWVTFTSVYVFALASGGSSFLEVVYPNELFPTEVRATAVGVGTAFSRIGSAAATSETRRWAGSTAGSSFACSAASTDSTSSAVTWSKSPRHTTTPKSPPSPPPPWSSTWSRS